MIDGQLTRRHFIEVRMDFVQLLAEPLQTHQLVCDSLRQRTDCRVLYVPASSTLINNISNAQYVCQYEDDGLEALS